MAGVVFVVSIPTEDKERLLQLKKTQKRPPISSKEKLLTRANDFFKLPNLNSRKQNESSSLLNENTSVYHEKQNSITMKTILESVLDECKVENAVWNSTKNGNYFQIVFTMDSGEFAEKLLNVLKENEIGSKFNSTLSVIPCAVYYKGSRGKTEDEVYDDESDDESKNSMWSQFVLSVRARPTIMQIVENIKSHAVLTFDFVCLLVIATTLCAIGLVENNNVYLLSSMLISPMMGPVLAATFGSVIGDKTLQKIGVQSEMLGLGIALLVGYCYGAIICLCTDKYGENDWPTNEMIVRGELRTLGVGCLIAILSGAALALGQLSDNTASLVGVAISTSLMPPAVNAGLLWSVVSIYYIKETNETERYSNLSQTNYFSNDQGTEITCLGTMSLCLTFVNIICIYIAALIVFKIKEVAPIASRGNEKNNFWNQEWKFSKNIDKRQLHHSIDVSRSLININNQMTPRHEYTWSPSMEFAVKPTIKELEDIYFQRLLKDNVLSPQIRKLSGGYSTFQNDIKIHIPGDAGNEEVEPLKNENKSQKFVVTPSKENNGF